MATKTVVFDGWIGGEFGSLSPREAGRQLFTRGQRLVSSARLDSFTGKNLLRYRDGLLGPRAGIKTLGITGAPNGAISALGGSFTEFWFVVGSTAYHVSRAGGAVTAYTMTDSITGPFVFPGEVAEAGSISYLLVYGDAAYKLVHGTHTVTKIAAMPAGRACLFYSDRLLIAGTVAQPQRLYFSDPGGAGWETFGALNYVDLPGVALTSLLPYRNGLLVGSAAGQYTLITGTLGSDAVARTITRQGSPGDAPKGAALATDEVVYMGQSKPWVTVFNGAVHNELSDQRFAGDNYTPDTTGTPAFRLLKLLGPDEWLALSGLSSPAAALNRALMHNGTDASDPGLLPSSGCSYHTWEQNIGAWAMELGGATDQVLLVKDGDGSHPPVLYVWNARLDRPGFTSDALASPGDGSSTPIDAYVHTPEWLSADGNEVTVRKIIVDFRKWATGAAATNHFAVTARTLNLWNTTGYRDSAAQSFDEAGASTTTAGEDETIEFGVGDQGSGHGFQIRVTDVRGCAIRSIIVVLDEQPSRG